jgi:hypothetical protein
MRQIVHVLALIFGTFPAASHGARPFVTDDARVVDPGGYQLESFVKRQRAFGEQEFWFLPAHNPFERVEVTLGGIWVTSSLEGNSRALVAQVKTLLKPLQTNGAGYAVTLGMLRRASAGPDPGGTDPYLNAIGSFSLAEDTVVVHTNVGARRDAGAGVTRGTWGLGAEIRLMERLFGIVETYGERGDKPTRHVGLRVWLVPNRAQIDTTLGFEHSTPERRFQTVGVRLLW